MTINLTAYSCARANQTAVGAWVAVMSHELRTPLNAISGYTELIELGIRGPVTPEQRADLANIRRSERHLMGLAVLPRYTAVAPQGTPPVV